MTEPWQIDDFEQVKRIVGSFSDAALIELAQGPRPDSEDREECRACDVLEKMAPHNGGAERLRHWHDFVEKGYSMISAIVKGNYPQKVEGQLVEELQKLIGTLSYSRCLIIYFAASAELESRRVSRLVRHPLADEEPDERDPRERRQDEEAEDAERRLDSEKVGDR